jgi:hypothetical protein
MSLRKNDMVIVNDAGTNNNHLLGGQWEHWFLLLYRSPVSEVVSAHF